MLKERGYFTFKELGGNDVTIRFCTYSLMLFCEREGDLTLNDFLQSVGGELKLRQIANLMLCGWEAANKGEAPSKQDAADWIDALGGISGEGMAEMIKVLVGSLTADKSEGTKGKNAKSR